MLNRFFWKTFLGDSATNLILSESNEEPKEPKEPKVKLPETPQGILSAIESGDENVIQHPRQWIIEEDYPFQENELSQIISYAAVHGHREILRLFLEEKKIRVHMRRNEFSPLYLAAVNGHYDAVEFLLTQSPFKKNQQYEFSDELILLLFALAQNGEAKILELLLTHFRTLSINDLVIQSGKNRNVIPIFLFAIKHNQLEVVKTLTELFEGESLFKPDSEGSGAFHYAALYGCIEIFDFLDENPQFSIVRKNKQANNIIHSACLGGQTEFLKHIATNARMTWRYNFTQPNVNERQPSFLAASNDHLEALQYLDSLGCPMDQIDQFRFSILFLAIKMHSYRTVDWLINHRKLDVDVSYMPRNVMQEILSNMTLQMLTLILPALIGDAKDRRNFLRSCAEMMKGDENQTRIKEYFEKILEEIPNNSPEFNKILDNYYILSYGNAIEFNFNYLCRLADKEKDEQKLQEAIKLCFDCLEDKNKKEYHDQVSVWLAELYLKGDFINTEEGSLDEDDPFLTNHGHLLKRALCAMFLIKDCQHPASLVLRNRLHQILSGFIGCGQIDQVFSVKTWLPKAREYYDIYKDYKTHSDQTTQELIEIKLEQIRKRPKTSVIEQGEIEIDGIIYVTTGSSTNAKSATSSTNTRHHHFFRADEVVPTLPKFSTWIRQHQFVVQHQIEESNIRISFVASESEKVHEPPFKELITYICESFPQTDYDFKFKIEKDELFIKSKNESISTMLFEFFNHQLEQNKQHVTQLK